MQVLGYDFGACFQTPRCVTFAASFPGRRSQDHSSLDLPAGDDGLLLVVTKRENIHYAHGLSQGACTRVGLLKHLS